MQSDVAQSLEKNSIVLEGGCPSILERIAAHATTGKAALVDGEISVSFAELETRSNQLATYLWEAGAGPETCIAILMERSAQFVVAALAVMKTGAAYLPIDPSTPAERIRFILSDSGASILLAHRQRGRLAAGAACRVIEVDEGDAAPIAARPATRVGKPSSPSSLAYVIYTSGSTGEPKGVEITHANLLNLIDWHNRAFNVSAADRASQVAGLGFDAAVWEMWPALTAGATLFFADEATRRSAQGLQRWLIEKQITIAFVPTVLAEQLLHAGWPARTALKTFLTGADTLHRRPPEGLPFVVVNNYGPTECTVVATSGVIAPDAAEVGKPSIGRPIDNAEVYLLDEDLQLVPRGEAGEICLAGAIVGRGYRNQSKLTGSRFVQFRPAGSREAVRIYRTGDRGRLLASGEIEFLGRVDDQVKIRGYRIELGEILARLDRCPGVQASAAVVAESEGGPSIVAYVVPAADAELNAGVLGAFLAEKLPDYMVPAKFVRVSELPMTANGKLDKSALPAPNSNNLLAGGAAENAGAPAEAREMGSDGIQSRISALVAGLLEQPSVGPHENFFMIGGHSMLGVQLVARIRDMFGVKLTLRQLFGAPTVAALSAEVERLTVKS